MFYALAVFNVFIAAVAQMMLKKSAAQKHSSFIYEYLNPWVICGYVLMGFSLISNIYAMSQGVLLKEMGAIGASSYLFVSILAIICFKEKFKKKKVFSVALIITGSIVFFL
jgi:drug/metabolite transporter (DMT)-like permease